MKKYSFVTVLFLFAVACNSPKSKINVDYVDPFIGTGGHGHTYPGPALPFGQIQPGPDIGKSGWDWCSGYHYSDTIIAGFSQTHLSGTGCPDLADILLIPTTKNIDSTTFDCNSKLCEKLLSSFKKSSEMASVGYYSVKLNNNIKVELTTTKRVGLHKYTYPTKSNKNIVIDLGYSMNDEKTLSTHIEKVTSDMVVGYRISQGWAKYHKVYFAAQFSAHINNLTLYADKEHNNLKAVLNFANTGDSIFVRIALSSADIDGALQNLASDKNGFNFNAVVRSARCAWEKELSKIKVETKDDNLKTIFYTALYHSFLVPNLYSDIDGRYKGFKHTIQKAHNYNHYTVLSLWDTFRALNPLLTITQPEVVDDLVKSMLAKYKETGSLPIWELMGNETYTMPGFHAVPVITDAIIKGQGDFDKELAYRAMRDFAMSDFKGLNSFRNLGFVPADKENESASKTLEYAYDCWCVGKTAEYLGKKDDCRYFYKLSKNYKNLFDAKLKFMRGKNSDQSWVVPFDPAFSNHNNDPFTEGNSWQWTWFVPHDIQHYSALFESKKAMIAKLDSLFSADSKINGTNASADISGLIGQYAHGNEPSHSTAFIYEVLDEKPWKTQEIVDKIVTTLYTSKPDGLSGNEDCGQMSAWYVFSSIGFYPYCPGDSKYYFARPMFDKVEIELPNGNIFKIITTNNSKINKYIASVQLNGNKLQRHYITHDEIMSGGELIFNMSDKCPK